MRYIDYTDAMPQNIRYNKLATPDEITSLFCGSVRGRCGSYYFQRSATNENKYWQGNCENCGTSHIVRSDRVKKRKCKCKYGAKR